MLLPSMSHDRQGAGAAAGSLCFQYQMHACIIHSDGFYTHQVFTHIRLPH